MHAMTWIEEEKNTTTTTTITQIESIQLAYDIMCVSHIPSDNEIRTNFIHSILKFGALANDEPKYYGSISKIVHAANYVHRMCSIYALDVNRCFHRIGIVFAIFGSHYCRCCCCCCWSRSSYNNNYKQRKMTIQLYDCVSSDWIFSELYSFLSCLSLLERDWVVSVFFYMIYFPLYSICTQHIHALPCSICQWMGKGRVHNNVWWFFVAVLALAHSSARLFIYCCRVGFNRRNPSCVWESIIFF